MPKGKLFYGWVVVFASAAAYFLHGGARLGGFGNFLKPISDEFGWSRALISGAASLGRIETAIHGPIVGVLIDRFGSRIIMAIGFAIGAAGFFVLSFVHSVALFYVVYVLLIPLGLGAVQLAGQTAVANWFVRKRSRALSIITIGFATGATVMTPGIGWMVTGYGWRSTSAVLGILVVVVGIAVVLLTRDKPEKYGLLPDGDARTDTLAPSPAAGHRVKAPTAEIDFTVRQAMATKAFWLITAGLTFQGLATSAASIHTIPLLTDRGISAQAAANFVGLYYFWGIFGRLMWGYLGDFVAKRYLLAIAVLLEGAGILLLANFSSTLEIYLYTVLFGVGQAVIPVQFAIRGEYFGRSSFAAIAGAMAFFTTIGGVIGPVYAGRSFDITGSYQLALTVVAGAAVIAAVLFWLARRPQAVT